MVDSVGVGIADKAAFNAEVKAAVAVRLLVSEGGAVAELEDAAGVCGEETATEMDRVPVGTGRLCLLGSHKPAVSKMGNGCSDGRPSRSKAVG